MMYTEEDLRRAKVGARRELFCALGFMALGVGLMVAALIVRNRVLGLIGLIVPMLAGYAWYGLRAAPWRKYARFMSDVFIGLSRSSTGAYLSAEEDVHMTEEGIEVRCVSVLDAEGDEVMFYWDCDRALPPLESGKQVRITSYGRYITGLSPA